MTKLLSPPSNRTHLGRQMTAAVTPNELHLQQCENCGAVQYPPREVCGHCLSSELTWRSVDPKGKVIAGSELYHSLEPWFREQSPWLMGAVKLDCGPTLLAHLTPDVMAAGSDVWVVSILDASEQSVLVAVSQSIALQETTACAEKLITRQQE